MLQWVAVTTVLAPAWLIRLQAVYLKLLGADLCLYFIDRPASYTEAELAELSQYAKLFLCDDSYWQSVGGRPENLAARQLTNVQFARSQVDARWFLHIDIDEFPHFTGDIGRMLAGAPEELAEFHFQNVERLIVPPPKRTTHARRARSPSKQAGRRFRPRFRDASRRARGAPVGRHRWTKPVYLAAGSSGS